MSAMIRVVSPHVRPKEGKGQAVVEVLIAILLIAAVAAGIFGSVLTAQYRTRSSETRESVALYSNRLLQDLKGYVTADPTVPAGAPGNPPWHMPGDTCPGGAPDCWALAPGDHDVTVLLPAWLRGPPYNASMIYRVAPATVHDSDMSRVQLNVSWTEPNS